MRLTDGERTVLITMSMWDGTNLSPDMSNDFFESGSLTRVWVEAANEDICKVPDVEYCIEQAEDWANYRGDHDDTDAREEDRKKGLERWINVEDI